MLTVPDGLIVRRTEAVRGVVYRISAVCKGKPEKCPKCDCKKFWRSGTYNRVVTDIPHNNTPVEIDIEIPRVQCRECLTQFGVTTPDGIERLARITVRLKRFILDCLNCGQTFTQVANLCGVSFDTVSRVYRSSTGGIRTNWRSLPRTPKKHSLTVA